MATKKSDDDDAVEMETETVAAAAVGQTTFTREDVRAVVFSVLREVAEAQAANAAVANAQSRKAATRWLWRMLGFYVLVTAIILGILQATGAFEWLKCQQFRGEQRHLQKLMSESC